MATVRLRPASPDAVPACHRPPRRSMPHPRQVAPTNEGERVGYGTEFPPAPSCRFSTKKKSGRWERPLRPILGRIGYPKSPGDQCPSHPLFGLALLGPHVARELRCSKVGVRRLGQAKARPSQIHTSSPERGCRTRVSTPERLHCVDHPRLVGDPVGLRSAGTWREDPRSFSRDVACRRRGLKEWSDYLHRVRVDSARGAGRPSERGDAVERVQGSFSPTTMRSSLGRRGQVHHLP